jgi:hypothetical protein
VPIYSYWCQLCGEVESQRRGDDIVCHCGRLAKRHFAWTTGTVLHEHYNPAFGQVVSSLRQAKDLAKIASADQSERLGMDVNYELTQLHDYEGAGIDKAEKEEVAARTAEAQS